MKPRSRKAMARVAYPYDNVCATRNPRIAPRGLTWQGQPYGQFINPYSGDFQLMHPPATLSRSLSARFDERSIFNSVTLLPVALLI